ncbi:hypothetical protein ColTof3_06156 [Colletotrichum tofieldiae]|nr:hypothetical protein ColTof3_06156 [Colletotrichum tofieldiae]
MHSASAPAKDRQDHATSRTVSAVTACTTAQPAPLLVVFDPSAGHSVLLSQAREKYLQSYKYIFKSRLLRPPMVMPLLVTQPP